MSGHEPHPRSLRWRPLVHSRVSATVLSTAMLLSGCAGELLRLAEQGKWAELDRVARAKPHAPRGKGARAWAQALVELGSLDEARALLQADFRNGGQVQSMLALAELERREGLLGIAAAHYTRLLVIDLDSLRESPEADAACELLRARAAAELELGQALAADTDMRRLALACPQAVTQADRDFLSNLRPAAQAEAEGRRALEGPELEPPAREAVEAELASQLELARKRGPSAVAELAAALDMQVEPDDIAVLLAAELGGGLGPGLISDRRVAGWIGDNDIAAVLAAIEGLPEGVREYALLRVAAVRPDLDVEAQREGWIVGAMQSLAGQGPQEAAKSWRVAAIHGDLGGAEFALNTNLRNMIPAPAPVEPVSKPKSKPPKQEPLPAPAALPPQPHWSLRVPVDRRSFDLLLTLGRLFELRGQSVQALELRRAVLVAGHEVGLAQVSGAAVEEVRRQLALGQPWQALAIAEVVPGPLLDEVLGAIASAIGLRRAVGLMQADEVERSVIRRALGEEWLGQWDQRLEAGGAGLDLAESSRCPSLGSWLDAGAEQRLRDVGLDPARSRLALEAAFADLGAPATGTALARALESDLALSCGAPLINLLHAGPHALTLAALDERMIHVPELEGALQLQLLAELALAHGEQARASLLSTAASAQTPDPREIWARAAVAGRSYGGREYTIEALRQVLLHSPGVHDEAARRELTLMRLRDVDVDELLRAGDATALANLGEVLSTYLSEAPAQRRWARLDRVLWMLAGERRVDVRAWELLSAALLDEQVRLAHPQAVAAFERAAAGEVEEPAASDTELLGDTASLCGLDPAREAPERALGMATACDIDVRARALAVLLAGVEAPQQLRAAILAGPLALEVTPERPGIARTVAALGREGLVERLVFGLPIEPVFVVD